MTTLFDAPVEQEEKEVATITSYRELLVGEGKKFKDEEALAKGKYEADILIPQLLEEKRALEAKLQDSITLQSYLDQVTKKTQESTVEPVTPPSGNQNQSVNAPTGLTKEEIKALLKETYQEENSKSIQAQNVEKTRAELIKAFGSANYLDKLSGKLKDLEMDQDTANHLAATKPKAFLAMVVGSVAPNSNNPNAYLPPATSRNNSPQMVGNTVRNQEYYENLKRTNPAAYNSEAVRAQRYDDAKRLGESYFKK